MSNYIHLCCAHVTENEVRQTESKRINCGGLGIWGQKQPVHGKKKGKKKGERKGYADQKATFGWEEIAFP